MLDLLPWIGKANDTIRYQIVVNLLKAGIDLWNVNWTVLNWIGEGNETLRY